MTDYNGQTGMNVKGKAEGMTEKAREMARGLRDDGVSLEIISRRSGLSIEEIKAL